MDPCAATKEIELGNGTARYMETTTSTKTMERMTVRGNRTKIG